MKWLAVSSLAVMVVERQSRRLLPLAALLKLSMIFPDKAPSRYGVALRAGTVRNLEDRVAEMHKRGVDDEPARAARQILELVGAMSVHDRGTRGHAERVRAYADLLGAQVGLTQDERDRLRWAALLHDVGKVSAGLGVYGRVVATLAGAAAGRSMAGAWTEGKGFTRRVGLYLRHASLGADMLTMAGSDSLTVTWAREHHLPEEEWTLPPAIARALKAADDD